MEDNDINLEGNIKIVFSRYCASGFFGDNCVCQKCCQIHNKPYDKEAEHKNWVYSQVMKGESFLVENVKPMVHFNENGKMEFGRTFTYMYQGSIVDDEK